MGVKRNWGAAILTTVVSLSGAAWAQAWPAKPVRMVIGFAPGGGVDAAARYFAQKLGESWKQPVVVENRAGAGGNIGADAVAKAAPDGYTLLFTPNGLAISPGLFRKLPFDAQRDFAPVSLVATTYLALSVSSSLAASSVKELIALAKAQPGKFNFGSSGVGSSGHIMSEIFKSGARIDIVHIPYKSDAQSVPALLAGEVHMVFVPLTTAVPQVSAGRLRMLGVAGLKRANSAPNVPTMVEAGIPEFNVSLWLGMLAPAGTPMDIQSRISADIARMHNQLDVIERMPGLGLEAASSTPAEFSTLFRADIDKYTKIIKSASIPLSD